MPGVLGIFTGTDLVQAGYGTLKCIVPFNNRDGTPMIKPPRPALPVDKVRFVGDPVALVIADNRYIAEDAAELVVIDYEPLPAVVDYTTATTSDALVHQDFPNNLVGELPGGSAEAVDLVEPVEAPLARGDAPRRKRAVPVARRGDLPQIGRAHV